MIRKILSAVVIGAAFALTVSCNGGGEFKKVHGIEYKIVKHGTGKKKAAIGDIIQVHLLAKVDTTVLGDSRKQNDNKPIPQRVDSVRQSGQWQAVFPYLVEGDSVLVQISCDTILKNIPPQQLQQGQLPPWMKKGKKIMITLSVASIGSMADYQKDMQEKQAAQQREMQQKASQQAPIDDKIIQDYLAKNNIKAEKTASGVYYVIHKEGSGPAITKGQKVSMDYTGKTLDGKMFDSNVDPAKGHVQPFVFTVGMGQVIPGWDEGVQMLKKGSKATLYIPSPLAYGPRGAGADIAPNTVLMFDVEVKEVLKGGDETK
jgi:FKBP-type peptidyl-prolyl cis-trans isomerase